MFARVAPIAGRMKAASRRRLCAMTRYLVSISTLTLLRLLLSAAMAVVLVLQNGSRMVSPAKENILIKRSASEAGYGAGCPLRVDSLLMSVHVERNQVCISPLFNI